VRWHRSTVWSYGATFFLERNLGLFAMLKNKNDIMKYLLRSLLIFFCSLSLLPGATSNLENNIRHRMEKDLSPIIEAGLVKAPHRLILT